MNQRIQELVGKTNIWAQSQPGAGTLSGIGKWEEKFAELIVAECVTFLNTTVEVYTQAEQDACVRAACGLKNYFEIK